MNAIEKKERLMRLATYFSVLGASSIVLVKFYAFAVTDSLTILSSLVDSVLDVLASTVNLLALRYALSPADDDHRFGHSKAEDIASLVQATLITGAGIFIVTESIHRFLHPMQIEHERIGIAVMTYSLLMTLAIVMFQKHVVRKTNSNIIHAESYHYLTDVLANITIIISLFVIMKFGITWLDPLLAVVVSIYIFLGAWKIGRGAFNNLMDKELSDAERKKIEKIVLGNKNVKGMHDLRTRAAGSRRFIQFHIELDGDMPLTKAHKINDKIEEEILKKFPGADILIHMDIKNDMEEERLRRNV